MTGFQFARLKIEGPYPLRRGAWYRVTDETSETVVFDVNRRPVTVPRSLVELVGGPPRLWTIVPRPVNAVRVPAHWGWWYAVCPSCKHRSALNAAPQTMRCPRCKGVFRFAREESYLPGDWTPERIPDRSSQQRPERRADSGGPGLSSVWVKHPPCRASQPRSSL